MRFRRLPKDASPLCLLCRLLLRRLSLLLLLSLLRLLSLLFTRSATLSPWPTLFLETSRPRKASKL